MALYEQILFCAVFRKECTPCHNEIQQQQKNQDLNKSTDKASFSLCPMFPAKLAPFNASHGSSYSKSPEFNSAS